MATAAYGRKSDLPPALPQNLDAERSILGAILVDARNPENNLAVQKATEILHSGDFFLPQHERIFRTLVKMSETKEAIDLVTITETLYSTGELEESGGAPYLAQLMDGMPRISNIEHYARIVSEKSRLRQIIRTAHNLEQQAFENDAVADELLVTMDQFLKNAGNGHNDRRLVAVDLLDFLTMKLDPIDFIIEPILPVSNSGMIYSPTGAGKTYIMLYMAYCVAIGHPECFVWNIPKARPVVYVDGEMDSQTLQERQQEILRGFLEEDSAPKRGFFKVITPDLQPKYPPRINTKEGRARIEEHLTEGCLFVADNISTLCPGGDDEESEDWAQIQEWILYLRRKKVASFMVHHAGKSGTQLGTSKKEHQLACNLRLRTASDYVPGEGLRVEARLDKLRRRGKDGRFEARWVQPFEITLRVDAGAATFAQRPMLEILRRRAVEMLLAGMRENDVALETGLNRFQIYRIKQKLKSEGAAAAEHA